MKKLILLVAAVVAFAANAQAQKGAMAGGAQIAFGSGDSFSNTGIGVKFQYNVMDQLRAEPSFTYYLKKDNVGMWDFSLNAHYLFPVMDGLNLYPLAGLSMFGVSVSIPEIDLGPLGTIGGGSESSSEIGLNIGGGADYALTENIAVGGEIRMKMGGDWSRTIIAIGAIYKF